MAVDKNDNSSPRTLLAAAAQRVMSGMGDPRIRRETSWVIFHKLAEFVVTFVALKLFTNIMTKEAYGEFNLALLGTLLITSLVVMPMNQAYFRYLPQAEADGVARSAGASLLRWNAIATVLVAALAALFTLPLSRGLGLGAWTVLAAGLVFLANRWRSLGIQALDFQRRRKACAVQNVGFLAVRIVTIVAVLVLWDRSAASALFGHAIAAALFAVFATRFVVHAVRAQPPGAASDIARMVRQFGVPYGAVLILQWIQSSAERYILAVQLDLETAGLYAAAYQVCGIPFMLFSSVFTTLALPIVYQRAKIVTDSRQLWSADRLVLGCIFVYLALGGVMLAFYWLWGQQLLSLLTSKGFVLPATTILVLAIARYVQCLGLLLQMFFSVHQRMGASLGFRAVGSVLVVVVSWYTVKWYGVSGAAVGILISGLIYTMLVFMVPGGCLSLVREARRGLPSNESTRDD